MAIKGNAYTKTTWVFEERPVASSKLNTWDDRIEAALELAFYLLSRAWGGANGVVRDLLHELAVAAKATPGLSVEVRSGYGFINGHPFKLAAATETVDVAPPLTHDRIDLVQARLDGWAVTVKTGAEAAAPSPPAADPDCLPLAQLHLRPGMASIKNSDDSVNGYITDIRPFL